MFSTDTNTSKTPLFFSFYFRSCLFCESFSFFCPCPCPCPCPCSYTTILPPSLLLSLPHSLPFPISSITAPVISLQALTPLLTAPSYSIRSAAAATVSKLSIKAKAFEENSNEISVILNTVMSVLKAAAGGVDKDQGDSLSDGYWECFTVQILVCFALFLYYDVYELTLFDSILSDSILFHLILSYLILSYLILSYLILSYLILSYDTYFTMYILLHLSFPFLCHIYAFACICRILLFRGSCRMFSNCCKILKRKKSVWKTHCTQSEVSKPTSSILLLLLLIA